MSALTPDTVVENPSAPNFKIWTDEAFMALPDGHRYEIVNGELVLVLGMAIFVACWWLL